ncbi:hypothetical protein Bca4012_100643 [Brassica carinata]
MNNLTGIRIPADIERLGFIGDRGIIALVVEYDFSKAPPKYSFMLWIAMLNRMQTGDKMQAWSAAINTECVLCHEVQESCQHLFFNFPYSFIVWESLVKGILKEKFTTVWNDIVALISGSSFPATEMFLIRYSFQAAIHSIWCERNSRRHGEEPKDARVLSKQ